MEINIYTDGACSGNPGPGGWGALLIAKKQAQIISTKEIYGGEGNTTNNRMELTAAMKALSALKNPFQERSIEVIISFGLGALAGLLSFSKLLKFILAKFYSNTMMLLIGFMIGAMGKIWPYREVLESAKVGKKIIVLSHSR